MTLQSELLTAATPVNKRRIVAKHFDQDLTGLPVTYLPATYREVIRNIIEKYSGYSSEDIKQRYQWYVKTAEEFFTSDDEQVRRIRFRLALYLAEKNKLPEHKGLVKFGWKAYPSVMADIEAAEEQEKEDEKEEKDEEEENGNDLQALALACTRTASTSEPVLNKKLLDSVVEELPPRFDALFQESARYEGEKGTCVTFSRLLAESLEESGIQAAVVPVYIITANGPGRDYLNGRMRLSEAIKKGGKVQVWGDVSQGQAFQHAVCYIPEWDVVIDLGMARRGSGLVPSHPYWATRKGGPWWLYHIEIKNYPIESRVYELYPDKVARAKEMAREVIRKWL